MSGAQEIYDEFLASWLMIIESPEALALDKVQDGAKDCLLSWKSQGIRLTLVTLRKNKFALDEQLRLTGLRQILDDVLVCDHADGGEGKAAAVSDFFQDRLSIQNSLWIGDTEADWQAAQSLGCRVVLLANGLRNEAYLRSLDGAEIKPSIMSLIV